MAVIFRPIGNPILLCLCSSREGARGAPAFVTPAWAAWCSTVAILGVGVVNRVKTTARNKITTDTLKRLVAKHNILFLVWVGG